MWHWVWLIVRLCLIASGLFLAFALAAAAYFEYIWPGEARRRPRR